MFFKLLSMSERMRDSGKKVFDGGWCQPAGIMLNGDSGLWLTSHITLLHVQPQLQSCHSAVLWTGLIITRIIKPYYSEPCHIQALWATQQLNQSSVLSMCFTRTRGWCIYILSAQWVLNEASLDANFNHYFKLSWYSSMHHASNNKMRSIGFLLDLVQCSSLFWSNHVCWPWSVEIEKMYTINLNPRP